MLDSWEVLPSVVFQEQSGSVSSPRRIEGSGKPSPRLPGQLWSKRFLTVRAVEKNLKDTENMSQTPLYPNFCYHLVHSIASHNDPSPVSKAIQGNFFCIAPFKNKCFT